MSTNKASQEKNYIHRGRYKLFNSETGKAPTFRRVTTLSSALDDKSGLIDWTARHVAKGLAHDDADYLLNEASRLDVTDRGRMDRVWQAAKKLAGGNEAADNGTLIHGYTEDLDRGLETDVPRKWRGHVQRYADLMAQGPLEVIPEYIERIVINETLGTAGTFDRIYRVKRDTTVAFSSGRSVDLKQGELVIGDVKTSKTLVYSQLSFAIQFAAYANSQWIYNTESETYDPMPLVNKEVAFVIWIPSTKTQSSITAVDITGGWDAAQMALQVLAMRNSKKLLSDTYVPEDTGPVDTETFEYRIRHARSREELSALWKEASSMGMWNAELAAMGKNRMADLGL